MIRSRQQLCTIADDVFTTAYETIVKSGAAQSIENYWRRSSRGGGRKAVGVNYTVMAVLVALLVRFLIGRPYSLRGAMDALGEFSADQLAVVGMAGQDCAAIRVEVEAEYKRFHRFWNLRLQPLDPDFDLPAKRMTNAEFHARLHARTDADRTRSVLADQRLTTLINDLLYGSILVAAPANCDGDIVVDETIINTAGPDGMLGSRPERYRGASSIARYWARDKRGQVKQPGTPGDIKSSGFGVGATFVSRVARRDALHAEPTLFVGMDVHAPTSGSVDGLATALAHANRTGVSGRRDGSRTRRPLLTADMGYNPKTDSPNSCRKSATRPSCATRNTGPSNTPAPTRPEPRTDPHQDLCNTPVPSTARRSSNASPDTAPPAPKNYSTRTTSAPTTADCKPFTHS